MCTASPPSRRGAPPPRDTSSDVLDVTWRGTRRRARRRRRRARAPRRSRAISRGVRARAPHAAAASASQRRDAAARRSRPAAAEMRRLVGGARSRRARRPTATRACAASGEALQHARCAARAARAACSARFASAAAQPRRRLGGVLGRRLLVRGEAVAQPAQLGVGGAERARQLRELRQLGAQRRLVRLGERRVVPREVGRSFDEVDAVRAQLADEGGGRKCGGGEGGDVEAELVVGRLKRMRRPSHA